MCSSNTESNNQKRGFVGVQQVKKHIISNYAQRFWPRPAGHSDFSSWLCTKNNTVASEADGCKKCYNDSLISFVYNKYINSGTHVSVIEHSHFFEYYLWPKFHFNSVPFHLNHYSDKFSCTRASSLSTHSIEVSIDHLMSLVVLINHKMQEGLFLRDILYWEGPDETRNTQCSLTSTCESTSSQGTEYSFQGFIDAKIEAFFYCLLSLVIHENKLREIQKRYRTVMYEGWLEEGESSASLENVYKASTTNSIERINSPLGDTYNRTNISIYERVEIMRLLVIIYQSFELSKLRSLTINTCNPIVWIDLNLLSIYEKSNSVIGDLYSAGGRITEMFRNGVIFADNQKSRNLSGLIVKKHNAIYQSVRKQECFSVSSNRGYIFLDGVFKSFLDCEFLNSIIDELLFISNFSLDGKTNSDHRDESNKVTYSFSYYEMYDNIYFDKSKYETVHIIPGDDDNMVENTIFGVDFCCDMWKPMYGASETKQELIESTTENAEPSVESDLLMPKQMSTEFYEMSSEDSSELSSESENSTDGFEDVPFQNSVHLDENSNDGVETAALSGLDVNTKPVAKHEKTRRKRAKKTEIGTNIFRLVNDKSNAITSQGEGAQEEVSDAIAEVDTAESEPVQQRVSVPPLIILIERLVELLIDLLSQLWSRRFIIYILKYKLLLNRVSCASITRIKDAQLLRQLLSLLKFYALFQIIHETGESVDNIQALQIHYEKCAHFQKICFQLFKIISWKNDINSDDFELVNGFKTSLGINCTNDLLDSACQKELVESLLKEVYLSNIGNVITPESLEPLLRQFPEKLLQIVGAHVLHIIPSHVGAVTNYIRHSYNFPPIPFTPNVLTEDSKSLLIDALILHLTKRPPFSESILSTPLFPTETLLWNSNLVPTAKYNPHIPLPLPKLNLQFLTHYDYLIRNFNLYRLESSYEIREDLQEAILRMLPEKGEKDTTKFHGSDRMALRIEAFNITVVDKPKVGETVPARVCAELSICLDGVSGNHVTEWDSLSQYDVVFLVSVLGKSDVRTENLSVTKLREEMSVESFLETNGVVAVRGAEVYEVIDETGHVISDQNPARYKAPSGTIRKIKVRLDPCQYAADVQLEQEGKSDVYSSLNLIVRRESRANNFKAVLSTIGNLIRNSMQSTSLPEWLNDLMLGYGKADSAHYKNLPFELNELDFFDTFLDERHLRASFPYASEIVFCNKYETFRPAPHRIKFVKDSNGRETVFVTNYQVPARINRTEGFIQKRNTIRFDPVQIECIRSGINKGLTLMVGPPGTGKTDTAVQICSLLLSNYPSERVLVIAHSNRALNDIFSKIVKLDVDSTYLLRLGYGERDLESGGEDFTKWGRINAILQRRINLLEEVKRLANSLSLSGDYGGSCYSSIQFYNSHVQGLFSDFRSIFIKFGLFFGDSTANGNKTEIHDGSCLNAETDNADDKSETLGEQIIGLIQEWNKVEIKRKHDVLIHEKQKKHTGDIITKSKTTKKRKKNIEASVSYGFTNPIRNPSQSNSQINISHRINETSEMVSTEKSQENFLKNDPILNSATNTTIHHVQPESINTVTSNVDYDTGDLSLTHYTEIATTDSVEVGDSMPTISESLIIPKLLEGSESVVSLFFPFKEFFSFLPQPIFPPLNPLIVPNSDIPLIQQLCDARLLKKNETDMAIAEKLILHIQEIFEKLKECQAFELLLTTNLRGSYLLTRHVKIIAMTCTHACLVRENLLDMNIKYDSLIFEEAAQILEVEAFIPMLLQYDYHGKSRLKRVILIGDHNQLPPVIQNRAICSYGRLDQSMFARFVRLGVPHTVLNKQGRARPSLMELYSWKYKGLGNHENVIPHDMLDHNKRIVPCYDDYEKANTGLVFHYQFINVEDFQGVGEYSPRPFVYQNMGEAEYVVSFYMFLRLIGYPASRISLLTTYNGQVSLLNEVVKRRCTKSIGYPASISTVDKYQGQQNDIILLSLVRTNHIGHIRDVRRLVVAISRAKLGLYIFGRFGVFSNCIELQPVFSLLAMRPTRLSLLRYEEKWPTTRPYSQTIPQVDVLEVTDVHHMVNIVRNRAAEIVKEMKQAYERLNRSES